MDLAHEEREEAIKKPRDPGQERDCKGNSARTRRSENKKKAVEIAREEREEKGDSSEILDHSRTLRN